MKKRREVQEILKDIKQNSWGFDNDDFLQYTKINLEFIHKAIRDGELKKIKQMVSRECNRKTNKRKRNI